MEFLSVIKNLLVVQWAVYGSVCTINNSDNVRQLSEFAHFLCTTNSLYTSRESKQQRLEPGIHYITKFVKSFMHSTFTSRPINRGHSKPLTTC